MAEQFANLAEGTLSAGISNSATSLTLQSGEGTEFPALGYDSPYFWGCLIGVGAQSSQFEIVRVTEAVADTFTIERAKQGTTAYSFNSGTRFALRITKQTLDDLRDGSRIVFASGWSASNYLNSGTGVLNGEDPMVFNVLVRLGRVQTAPSQRVIAAAGTLYTEGWDIRFDSLRPGVAMAVDGSKLSTSGADPNWSPGVAGSPMSYGFIDWKTVMITLRYVGEFLSIYVNGIQIRELDFTSTTSITPGSTGMRLGCDVDGSSVFDGGIAGWSFVNGSMDSDDIADYHQACMQANDVIDDGWGFEAHSSFKQMGLRTGDAVPTTVPNLAGNSSYDLTKTGTLTIKEERPRWL